MRFRARVIGLAVVLALALATPAALHAQGGYFGQNKVQYRNFDFRVMKTDHFDIYYYPQEEEAARMASRMAERWYTRLSRMLNHELRGRQPLILYASAPHFWQTNAIQGGIGEGTGGVTEAFKRRIVLPFAGPLEATDHVLGHELVHAFQYDITGTNVSSNTAGALALPLWFIEGMAEYLSIGPIDPHTSMWMREAARREKLPDIEDLDNPRYFPYRYGHALWAFIGGKYGDRAVGDMLRMASGRGGYQEAIAEILGVDHKELSKQWHAAEFEAYRPVAQASKMPGATARALIPVEEKGPRLNVSPELSPDGTRMMFFSERDLFSIDLYMADAKTGKVIKKITDTATDPHLESLQFLTSAGAWDNTGKKFVFPGISKSRPIMTIVDVDSGRTEREIRFEEVDEVLNPTWSNDGGRIAFSGLIGGLTDLFVYDLATSKVTRLTSDAYAEMDPAWSPDGRHIAFSTDRYSTNLPTLEAGHPRLAIIDIASREVRQLGGFDNAKNISPQWTQDGRAIYFVSDRMGVSNIYRISLDGGTPTQLTNLVTGVTGITALSPAMSAAAGRLVFSAYEDDGYSVYALETEDALAGMPLVDLPRNAAVLPPRTEGAGPIYTMLQNETAGLPPPAAAAQNPIEEYKPKLSLDFAGQPSIGVGRDPFGTYATGGVSFLFSDMLGNHTVGTSVQMTSRFDEFGGGVVYMNRSRRWNWGVSLDQTPYVYRGYATGVSNVQGQDVFVEQEYRILQQDRGASGIISYPFSRAQRVEASGGVRQITLKEDITTNLYSLFTGQQFSQERETLSTYPTLNLGMASAAFVHDTSISGITSPIRGSRGRLELSQTSGSLNYTGALADMRTYLMPVRPFTFALRGMYYGRHGSDADSERLPTLYLGYPGLVRGYDQGSFRVEECGASIDGSCPTFDRLVGTRVGILNAELRFPLWSVFGGDNFYGPLPIEMALFADAGIADGRVASTRFLGDNGEWVRSAGIAMRINVLGFAVAEIDYVRPFDRQGRGWLWQFNLIPGF
jgi:Tol biopolymer transport system component